MASGLTRFGNDLYTGERSVPFIGLRVVWLSIAAVLMLIALAVPFVRGGGDFAAGFNFGIEFSGGSQFQVSGAAVADGATEPDPAVAEDAVHSVVPDAVVRVSTVGTDGVRVQTDQLTDEETQNVAAALEESYDTSEVTSSFVGPTWGADITRQALIGLGVFLLLAMILMAIYFRTWKMSLAAIVSLFHDLVITVGVYAATGFEITPAAVIGFLTILGFSLYDTVVVFDKIRENTSEMSDDSTRTFGETVNLAVNQTLVRSINTGVVAALPVAAILFIGSFVLGADTLRDISLALLVGTVIGTYSTPFVASPLYVLFRQGEAAIAKRDKRVLDLRAKSVAGSNAVRVA
jgi:preprotein translocase subunit SecF